MTNKLYWAVKNIFFGPFLRVYNRPVIEGREHIPAVGAAILASNHQSVMDSFFLPLMCPRQITFPAKNEYFTTPGVVGKLQKWFYTAAGQIPLDRGSTQAGEVLVKAARSVLDRGELFGIYPEGTRSPDGRIYRGKTGTARVALDTGVPIIPVAMIGARDANPIGSWLLRPVKVWIRVGEPINPQDFLQENSDLQTAARALTDHIMATLAELTGQPYVDLYAADVKKALAEGKGYPPTP